MTDGKLHDPVSEIPGHVHQAAQGADQPTMTGHSSELIRSSRTTLRRNLGTSTEVLSPAEPARIPTVWLTVVMVCCFFGGFLNLILSSPISLATITIDLSAVGMAFVLIAEVSRRRGNVRCPAWIAALGLLALIYLALAVISPEPVRGLALSFRDHVGYAVIGVYAYHMVDSIDERTRLTNRAIGMAAVVSMFGVLQATVPARLPERLLSPDPSTLFGYYGTDISRANGLVGNTIVYGALLSLFYCLALAQLTSGWSWRRFLLTGAIAAGILVSFSRMAILSLLVCSTAILVWSIWRRRHTRLLTSIITVAAFSVIGVWALWPTVSAIAEDSFLVGGLFRAENATVQQSNQGHRADIAIAVEILRTHPLAGVGIGTNAEGSVYSESNEWITDGALWARIADGGLLLAGGYALLTGVLIVSCYRATTRQRTAWLPQGLAVFTAFQFSVASAVNSAVFGKATFVMFWMMVGLALGGSGATARGSSGAD